MSNFKESYRSKTIPVELKLKAAHLLEAINLARERDFLESIPPEAEFSIKLPAGGDLSGTEYFFGKSFELIVRWDKQV